ncbi:MAG TPA: fatty acid desaturase [Moraxellaceae bacterium]
MNLDDIYKKNQSREGLFLKFRADRAPLALSLTVFALQLLAWHYLPLWAAALLALGLLLPLGSCAIFNHHQQHHGVFRAAVLNRAWDLVLGLQTMIGPYAWVLHHNLGHHPNYMNQPPCAQDVEDESRWARRDGSLMGPLEYTLNLLLRAPLDGLRVARRRPREGLYFLLMQIPLLGLHGLLIWGNWQNYLVVFLLPSFLMLLYVYWLTHEHHSGLYTDNPYAASRNRVGRLYNLRTFNLGYHTAHHLKPYIHWSLLPAYHELIKEKIPPECFVECR